MSTAPEYRKTLQDDSCVLVPVASSQPHTGVDHNYRFHSNGKVLLEREVQAVPVHRLLPHSCSLYNYNARVLRAYIHSMRGRKSDTGCGSQPCAQAIVIAADLLFTGIH